MYMGTPLLGECAVQMPGERLYGGGGGGAIYYGTAGPFFEFVGIFLSCEHSLLMHVVFSQQSRKFEVTF